MDYLVGKSVATSRGEDHSPVAFANIMLGGLERVTALTLNTARSAIEACLSGTNELLKTTDLQEASAIQASVVDSSVGTAFGYSRALYEITARTQEELVGFLESGLKSRR